MLKYLYKSVVFQEVPGETSLALAISGCQVRCKGCHSRELWEDKGIPLTVEEVEHLLKELEGVTCLLLMGGEHDINSLIELFIYAHKRVKTAWYCGLDMIPKDKIGILDYLDFVKIGRFDLDLGPLNSSTTNQKFYEIKRGKLYDCTNIFWK
jgi:anaerobic ribonucleoside-triphosphate reductase activating protein